MPEKSVVLRQLANLRLMDLDELREKYSELYGCETAMRSAEYLRRRLAYRIQEIYYGGLTEEDHRKLEKIAVNDSMANLVSKRYSKQLPRGTILSREWHGAVYEVTATGYGTYEYKGRTYRSLSAIALLITGSKWNGKQFFGLS